MYRCVLLKTKPGVKRGEAPPPTIPYPLLLMLCGQYLTRVIQSPGTCMCGLRSPVNDPIQVSGDECLAVCRICLSLLTSRMAARP